MPVKTNSGACALQLQSASARDEGSVVAPTIAVAALTTAIGFLVLVLSPVPMVRSFGLILVAGVLLGLVAALILNQEFAWRGIAHDVPAAPRLRIRPLIESDRRAVYAIDKSATGESRTTVLDDLQPLRGVGVADEDEALRTGEGIESVRSIG